MPSYYYTMFQKNPCVGRNERCPLKILALILAEKSVTKNFVRGKEKKQQIK